MSNYVTPTEVGYLSGVTSAVQTQLTAKAFSFNSGNVGSSDQALSSTTYADLTNMTVTFTTTKTNEVVLLTFYGEFYSNGIGGNALEIAYQIGASTQVMFAIVTNFVAGGASPIFGTVPLTITGAPGSYTVKLQYKISTASPTWTFAGTADAQVFGKVSIVQIG